MKPERSSPGSAGRMKPARLSPGDVLLVGAAGLRSRPTRVLLSALGIAIGIATMLSVLGISSSSQAKLLADLDRYGTGLLTVSAGSDLFGGNSRLPKESTAMVRAMDQVQMAGETGDTGLPLFRNDRVPSSRTGGLQVRAASLDLPRTLQIRVRQGIWLNAATAAQRSVVLGAEAADRLGAGPGGQVWISGQWWTVIGVLEPSSLAADIGSSALTGFAAAGEFLGFDGYPTTIYTRSAERSVTEVRALLPRVANPREPEEVSISRPSDLLAARAATVGAFTGLLIGIGAVALLVGGVGVANTMVISVLERRREIGLRRSLGATRGQVRIQFLVESLLLAVLGGGTGAALGTAVTYGFAAWRGLPAVLPVWALGGGLAATLLVGTVAGIYPAMRAAKMSPTLALSTT
jgi:putative ABC transport system permease protein